MKERYSYVISRILVEFNLLVRCRYNPESVMEINEPTEDFKKKAIDQNPYTIKYFKSLDNDLIHLALVTAWEKDLYEFIRDNYELYEFDKDIKRLKLYYGPFRDKTRYYQ